MKTDCAIIGKGPAGLSAAIYIVRSGLEATVIGRDLGALSKADKIENYFGFEQPLSGSDLVSRGISQAKRLGAKIITAEVTGANWEEAGFRLSTSAGSIESKCLILTTGMPRQKPAIPGVKEYEGGGLGYCAICDGFFYRGKKVAVIGNGNYALQEAAELLPFAAEIHLLTNGRELEADNEPDSNYQVNLEKILEIEGDGQMVSGIRFEGGNFLALDGIFIAEGTASALNLANSLGVATAGNAIVTEADGSTNLPGVYAAGDCTGGLPQIAVAVGNGAAAGLAAARYLKDLGLNQAFEEVI